MNEKQSQELQELQNLEGAGTLTEAQKERLDELKQVKALVEKTTDFEKKSKDLPSALAQKEHFREKAEKAEAELEALKKGGAPKTGLDVGDYIDISASLEGLDQREKEYLSMQHKMSGKPLAEIRKDENFILWQNAYRQKVENEKKTLPPSNRQPDANEPISLETALEMANKIPNMAERMKEIERLMTQQGMYSEGRPRADRVSIGR